MAIYRMNNTSKVARVDDLAMKEGDVSSLVDSKIKDEMDASKRVFYKTGSKTATFQASGIGRNLMDSFTLPGGGCWAGVYVFQCRCLDGQTDILYPRAECQVDDAVVSKIEWSTRPSGNAQTACVLPFYINSGQSRNVRFYQNNHGFTQFESYTIIAFKVAD